MADVVHLPGVFRPQASDRVEPADVLKNAADAGLRDVAVVGRTIAGSVEVWSSQPDADTALGLITRGMVWLSYGEQIAEPVGKS